MAAHKQGRNREGNEEMNVNEVYGSTEHLKAEDIGTAMPTYVMGHVTVKQFDNGDRKMILEFQEPGIEKTLVLNKTNAGAISDLYGMDSDGWFGHKIMLFTMPVDFNGKTVQAIRVRAPVASPPPHAAPAPQPGNVGTYSETDPPPR